MAAKKSNAGSKPGDEGKTIAIISYITWIGWIIALIMNMEKKNDFARFHIRQTLLIFIGSILAWIPFIGWIWGIFLFVLWIIGLIAAINGEKKEVPVLGHLAQEWFKGI
jgi:uncharacterized membrane protein